MKKESIEDFYDQLAKNYLELYGEEQREKWEEVLRILNKVETKDKICLELGCGIGIVSLKELFRLSIGVDISFESLKIAKEKSYYDFLIKADLDYFKVCKTKDLFLISVSVLQNLSEESVKKILKINTNQIHSVMFKSKGENYWKEIFLKNGFKFEKKVKNDLIFSKIIF